MTRMLSPYLLAFCLLLALGIAASPYASRAEEPICGGVVDRSDHSAPKVIESKEIRSFSTSFWRYDEDSPNHEAHRWNITVAKDDAGEVWAEINGNRARIPGGNALLAEVQEVLDRFGLVKFNGVDRVTSGLPPEYSPTRLKAEYASGERLYFRTNGNPDSPWTAAILGIFLPENTLDKGASGRNAR